MSTCLHVIMLPCFISNFNGAPAVPGLLLAHGETIMTKHSDCSHEEDEY